MGCIPTPPLIPLLAAKLWLVVHPSKKKKLVPCSIPFFRGRQTGQVSPFVFTTGLSSDVWFASDC